MQVYIQLVRPGANVRELLLQDGWQLEEDPQGVLRLSHSQVPTEEDARSRLDRLGLLSSPRLRIEFHPFAPDPASGPRRVLIVEDNPDGRKSLRLLLELWGFEVDVAADGPEGIRKALLWHPDYAVVDIGLPGLDGYEVARRVRGALNNHILLVALTGYGQPEDRRRAFQAGFDAHLTKPADLDALSQLLGAG